MKKIIKLSLLMFASAMSLGACSSKLVAINPLAEETKHFVTNTLHDIDVQPSNIEFVKDGKTDYVIICDEENDYAYQAALFIKSHIFAATGAIIQIVSYTSETTYTRDSKYIVLGIDELAEIAGAKKTTKDLKVTGYHILTKDNSVFTFVNHNYGFQQVSYALLKHMIGYDRISEEITLYKDDCSTMPIMNIVEVPDYQIRSQSNKVSSSYSYQTGFMGLTEAFYASAKVKFVHNSFDYLPLTLATTHPSWFAKDRQQVCYTAGGDEAEFNAMVDYVYKGMVESLETKPDCTIFALTIEDNHGGCECEACVKAFEKYKANSGAVIIFMNALDDKIQAYLEEKAEKENKPKRQVQLTFFAYQRVEKPPVVWDEATETYVPTAPEMICNPNVSVYIAPIHANYQESFYNEMNISARETLQGWAAICNSINYWLYETNFSHYLYPYNSFYNMAETYRFCVNYKAYYMFNEGQHNQGAVTAFGRFKEYFNQVFLIDVNTDYQELCDHWFDEYFKEGREPMYKMFDEIQQHLNFLKNEYYGELTGQIYDNIALSKYWPKQLLDRWMGYIDEAYKLVEPYKYTNQGLYKTLVNNIKLESIFPRYALLNHHSGKYSSSELKQMRSDFYYDCLDLNVTNTAEGGYIADLRNAWGL